MINFASDNVTGASPEVLQALVEANAAPARMPYGNDAHTKIVEEQLGELFETDVRAFLVATGTAANALALASLASPWGAIYCHEEAHSTPRVRAPEFFTGGAKLVPLSGALMLVEVPQEAIDRKDDVHRVSLKCFPSRRRRKQVLSIARIIGRTDKVAAEAGLKVHMDGAVSPTPLWLGCSPAEITWKAGVDVLSWHEEWLPGRGGHRLFRPDPAQNAARQRKRGGHPFSKMRLLSAQFEGYLAQGAWLKRASHANAICSGWRRLAASRGRAFPGQSISSSLDFAGVAQRLNVAAFFLSGSREAHPVW